MAQDRGFDGARQSVGHNKESTSAFFFLSLLVLRHKHVMLPVRLITTLLISTVHVPKDGTFDSQ